MTCSGAFPVGDGEPPVVEVDVVEKEFADRFAAGGVHRGQDQDEPGRRGRGGLDCLVHLVLAKGLGDAVGVLADLDAPRRIPEDLPLLLPEREQRPQCDQDVGAA
jgi:hypothetical protein